METKNPLSAMSYTNKDFSTVFVELLDLVKELSSKWDPTISNESDPGVILLKVNAIIADKNNYNIDKNILEAFPETVTQLENARSMYRQLAYNMAWYKAAKTNVMFKWIAELPEGVVAEIPRYTMLTNEDASVVFTTVNSVEFNSEQLTSSVEAIQGSIVTHAVNGSSTISLANLDSNNRLYLNDYSVAENGIFITNEGDKDTDLWTQVDNLQVRTKGNKYYEFGVDVRNGVCYVEFPEDISDLIGTGLTVRYINTDGIAGNISAKELDRFFDEISINVGNDLVALTNETVQLYNNIAAVDGADPEDLSTAYRNYRKTAGTFDTLVTLRDYVNAIYNSGFVSNCQVCDRFNDPQSSYQIITDDTASPVYTYQVANDSNPEVVSYARFIDPSNADLSQAYVYNAENHSMQKYEEGADTSVLYYRYSDAKNKDLTAFDLRMYLLQNVGTVQNITQYYNSFNSVPSKSSTQKQIVAYIEDQKCVSHDFKDIIPDQFFMFKNSYPIGIKIVPQYKLQQTDIDSVKANISSALISLLNSREVEFGEEPNYDEIYDAIINADERIKIAILDDFVYTTFATYWDANEKVFKDIPISDSTSPLVIDTKDTTFEEKAKQLIDEKKKDVLESAYFFTSSDVNMFYNFNDEGQEQYVKKGVIYRYNKIVAGRHTFTEYSTLRDEFRLQIIAKSILAGKTPLFKQEDKFEYSIDQEYIDSPTTDRVTTNLVLSPFAQQVTDSSEAFVEGVVDSDGENREVYIYPSTSSDSSRVMASYKLQENESLRFLAPSFSTQSSYSNYVKFEFVKAEESGEQLVKLNPDETIIIDKARIHVDDYKKLVTYDMSEMFNSEVSLGNGRGGTNALKLSTNKDTETYASASLHFNSNAQAGRWTIRYDCGGKTPWHQVIIKGYEFNDLQGAITEEYTTDQDSTDDSEPWVGHLVTFNANKCKSFSVTFWSTEMNVDMYIDNITIEQPGISDVSKQWTFDGVPVTNGETAAIWTKESDDWWTWRAGMGAQMFSGTRDYSLWQSSYIDLYGKKKQYSIPAGGEYQLRENDCITFFWRESDDDTAPYIYQCYKGIASSEETETRKSPIIKPTFVLNGVPASEAKVNPAQLLEKGTIPYGDSNYYTINQFYGDNDLSGTKEIQIRGINQLELKASKHLFYFVTNSIEDGCYKLNLKLRQKSNDVASYRYSLGPDEYFIYTDGKKESFEILGSGTLIAIDEAIPLDSENRPVEMPLIKTLSVKQVDVKDITNTGVSAIQDWQTPSYKLMFVREQQIHNLVAGDTLQVGIDDPNDNFTMIYDSGKTKEWSYKNSGTVNRPIFTSNADTVVRGFSVSYVNSGGTVTDLPTISVNSDDSQWVGRACLNIDCSTSDAQKIIPVSKSLQSMQSLTIEGNTTPAQDKATLEKYVCTNTDDDVQADSYYLESDVLINKVGGDNIDISYITLGGNRKDVNLYMYSIVNDFNVEPFSHRDDGDIELSWYKVADMTSKTVSVDVSLSQSNYILSVYNLSDTQNFSITTEGAGVTIEELSYPVAARGRYYYSLNVQESEEFKLIFTLESGNPEVEDSDVLIISPIFKFVPNNDFNEPYGITHDELLAKVKSLDIEKVFKYNYVVDEGIRIDDPLDSKKFFDKEHVFNANTLAKAELLLDTTGSYIHIVNNR